MKYTHFKETISGPDGHLTIERTIKLYIGDRKVFEYHSDRTGRTIRVL